MNYQSIVESTQKHPSAFTLYGEHNVIKIVSLGGYVIRCEADKIFFKHTVMKMSYFLRGKLVNREDFPFYILEHLELRARVDFWELVMVS